MIANSQFSRFIGNSKPNQLIARCLGDNFLIGLSASFLPRGVLDCNLTHRRSVAELCTLFKIKSNPMHPLSGALPLPYVPARVNYSWCFSCSYSTRSRLLVVGLLSIAEPLCPFRCLFRTI